MDDNKYPDLLVGAYDSGHVVHMKAAPVAHMKADVSFDRWALYSFSRSQ